MAKTDIPAVNSLILVHFVERQLEGWTFSRDHWPLHLTLIPWFTVHDEEAIVRSLERLAYKTAPLQLSVGPQANFGEDRTVPVNVISNQRPVRTLHEKLVRTLAEADTSYQDQKYMGSEFIAHINRYDKDRRHSSEGEEVLVNNFHLVRLLKGDICQVEQEFSFL